MSDVVYSAGPAFESHRVTPKLDRASVPIATISRHAWQQLASRALEPNGYYLPDWTQAIDASARDRSGLQALAAWRRSAEGADLIGLLPVISLWRAYRIPLPALVLADPYGTLRTPLIDRRASTEALTMLLDEARRRSASALVLRDVTIEGPVMRAITEVAGGAGLSPFVLDRHNRACLDATRDCDELLQEALRGKKLKELRRLRNRLAEHGDVRFEVASEPNNVASAIETFLDLESLGWKAARGTALKQHSGDTAFIRRAAVELAAKRQCEIVTLWAGTHAVAAGVVLRHLDRAFFFKLGVDPAFARYSVGVQLTTELTRHLCEDPSIASADSTAAPGHPMIEPIWRGRLAIGDVLVPLYKDDPTILAIRLALSAHRTLRSRLRQVVRKVRHLRGKAQ